MKTKRANNTTLMIDPDFQRLLPQLQEAESSLLEESILENGIIDPIVVWKGYIVDGHNRFSIARKHNLPFATRELSSKLTKDEVFLWMAQYQLGKRNCNLFGKVEVALKFKKNFAKLGKINQKHAGKAKNKLCHQKDKVKNQKIDALLEVGKIAGVSRNIVSQVQFIISNAPPNIIDKCRSGSLSIRNAYLRTGEIKRSSIRKSLLTQQTSYRNPSDSDYINKIICGDCLDVLKEMNIHSLAEKITCIITSPPYNNGLNYGNNCNDNLPYQEYLDWLGEVFLSACSLLRAGGRLIVNVSSMRNQQSQDSYKHPVSSDLIQKIKSLDCGFLYRDEIIWNKYNGTAANTGKCPDPINPIIKTTHESLVIWSKGQWELPNNHQQISDITYEDYEKHSRSVWNISSVTHNQKHPASFPERLITPLIKLFSFPGDIVLDPFNGSGTTTLCAAKTGRKFIGIEQNPVYCRYAESRIAGLS